MKVSVCKNSGRWEVVVNGSGRIFDSEEAALGFMDSVVGDAVSAVGSARETYFAMKVGGSGD